MRLSAWGNTWLGFLVSRKTGLYFPFINWSSNVNTRTTSGFCSPMICYERLPKLVAVYKENNEIFFQFGRRRWNLDQSVITPEHDHISSYSAHFDLFDDGQKILSISYPHVFRTWFTRIDPTYDGIDYDTDFFLAFLADHLDDPEWRDNARQVWK